MILQNTRENLLEIYKMLQSIDIKATENNMQNMYSCMVFLKKTTLQIEEELKRQEMEQAVIEEPSIQ